MVSCSLDAPLRWQRKKGQTALPCFCHSDRSARFPDVTTNGDLMTELAASAIALMLTIELAVAIACVAAWFELQRASEGRSAKQADGVAVARTPEPRWLAFAATLPLGPWAVGNACVYRNGKSPVTPLPPNGARPANTMAEVTLAVASPVRGHRGRTWRGVAALQHPPEIVIRAVLFLRGRYC